MLVIDILVTTGTWDISPQIGGQFCLKFGNFYSKLDNNFRLKLGNFHSKVGDNFHLKFGNFYPKEHVQ